MGLFLLSKLLPQYSCLPKTDDNDRTHKKKMMKIPYLDIWVYASFWTSFSQQQFKSLVLESWRFCASSNTGLRRKITYHILLIVFYINKLISMKDVGHNMLHLHVAQQLPAITLSSWTITYLLPMSKMLIRTNNWSKTKYCQTYSSQEQRQISLT